MEVSWLGKLSRWQLKRNNNNQTVGTEYMPQVGCSRVAASRSQGDTLIYQGRQRLINEEPTWKSDAIERQFENIITRTREHCQFDWPHRASQNEGLAPNSSGSTIQMSFGVKNAECL